MNIVGTAKKLEAGIARALDSAVRGATTPRSLEPLEIVHAVVQRVVSEIQPAGRGKHTFPFNRVKVLVAAPSREARARLDAVFENEPTLQTRIAEQLKAAGCHAPDLAVKTAYLSSAHPEWIHPQWHLEFARVSGVADVELPPAPMAAPQPRIELAIVKGAGVPQSASFAQVRIDLGRCVEVRDGRHHLIRTNHVAFSDEAGENDSVSRRHAHIEFTAESGEYRVHDDRSAHGTAILRDGKAIVVPSGSRGIRLRNGDEILLGEARLRVTI